SSRKTGAPCTSSTSASGSRPPQSAPSTSASTPPVRLAAPPTAPVIAYPPNFSVPPPNFPATPSSSVYAPSSTPDSQTSPILSAPPPPPQLTPAMQESREVSSLKSPTSSSGHGLPSRTNVTPSSSTARSSNTATNNPLSTSLHSSNPHGTASSTVTSSQTSAQAHSHQGTVHTPTTPKVPFGSGKTPSAAQRNGNEKNPPSRHDSMSALKSPVSGGSSLTGRSSSVSDSRKPPATPVAHKDPSTELLAGLFHNKPPTTDFRKLPKIEKKPSAVTSHNDKDHHGQEQSKKHSSGIDPHKKEKDHKPVRFRFFYEFPVHYFYLCPLFLNV
ncbi:hypothetical protein OESDEN_05255, partial [Oesophagostomum dentatum]